MKNMNRNQLLTELLKNDRIGEPDKAIEDRLMYSFLLKNSRSKLKQNSFASFAGWLFSAQSIGMKTALVSVVIFFSVFNSQFAFDSVRISGNDTIHNQRILLADTAHFIQPIDSIRNDSLN
ncbi:MAG: hypothetical protein Q8N05_15960 [Bacteroidota bacterium]|nr:hypothetical protein [Bacteroidota bacterium]